MKRRIEILSLILVFIMITTTNAKWIYSEKVKNYLWLDEVNNTIITNSYFWADVDEETERLYYAGEYGFIYVNKKIDENYTTNKNGEVIYNGELVQRVKQKSENDKVLETTKKQEIEAQNNAPIETQANIIIQETIEPAPETKASSIIYNNAKVQEDSEDINKAQVSSNTSRLLKNYILDKQNVELIKDKNINGTNKTNVLQFKTNGSFIQVNTKKYNKIIIKAEKNKYDTDVDYTLKFMVNGNLEDELVFDDDNYTAEVEWTYNLNDEVDLVLNSTKESGSQNFYIVSGRMSKYKEEDDE